MSGWLVTQRDSQFRVDGLNELKQLAADGKLVPGDMLQPPGTTDWLYCAEVPELLPLLKPDNPADFDDADLFPGRNGVSTTAAIIAGAVLALIAAGGGAVALVLYTQLPDASATVVGGDSGLSYSQMITTTATPLLAEARPSSKTLIKLQKDAVLDLVAKRGNYYRAQAAGGAEGYVAYSDVLPIYRMGGEEIQARLDPLYNPDQYLHIENAGWMKRTSEDERDPVIATIDLRMENRSKYAMNNFVLRAVIKDAQGNELDVQEFAIEGEVPAEHMSMVGTIDPPEAEFDGIIPEGKTASEPKRLITEWSYIEAYGDNEEMAKRWRYGLDMPTNYPEFAEAFVTLAEVRAMPESNLFDQDASAN